MDLKHETLYTFRYIPQELKLMVQSFMSCRDVKEVGMKLAGTVTGFCDSCQHEYWIKIPGSKSETKFHPVATFRKNVCFERWCDYCIAQRREQIDTNAFLRCRECNKSFNITEAKSLPTPLINDYQVEDLTAIFCSLNCALSRLSYLNRQSDYWHTLLSRQRLSSFVGK